MDSVSNLNENPAVLRNEQPIDRVPPSNQDSVPQVRKISRFQVSHVKEIDDLVKLPNIVHGTDIMLENISPEQHQPQQQLRQAQVAQDFVTHNIQSAIDKSSPDKVDPMIQQPQSQHQQHHESDQQHQQNQLRQLAGHIEATEVTMQPQMQHQDPSVAMQSQNNFAQPPPSPQSQLQPIQSQVQQQTVPNYPLIEPSHVINQQQALQTAIPPSIAPPQPVPIPAPVPVSSMPSQMIPTPSGGQLPPAQQQPTIVSQQQIK